MKKSPPDLTTLCLAAQFTLASVLPCSRP